MPWTRTGTGAVEGCYELGPFAMSHTVGGAGFFLLPSQYESSEEGSRDWRPQHGDRDSLPEVLPCDRESSVATSRPAAQESVGRDGALPSGDPEVEEHGAR